MVVSGKLYAPAALYPGERCTGTHCSGGWLDPTAGLNAVEKKKTLASAGASDLSGKHLILFDRTHRIGPHFLLLTNKANET
jgi:hypothetical protein